MTIRPARPEDCLQICELIRELAIYEKLEHQMAATPEALQRDLFGPDQVARSVVAVVENEVVGYAIFFRSYSTFLARPGIWLEDLYVKQDARGTGIGKALLSEVGAIAQQESAGRLEWSVLDWNQPAIDFYERIGATIMPDWRICRIEGENLDRFSKVIA